MYLSADTALKRLKDEFNQNDLIKIQELETILIESKVNELKFDSRKSSIISDIANISSKTFDTNFSNKSNELSQPSLIDNLYQRQFILLISKILESGNSDDALKAYEYLSKVRPEERRKKREEAKKITKSLSKRSLSDVEKMMKK